MSPRRLAFFLCLAGTSCILAQDQKPEPPIDPDWITLNPRTFAQGKSYKVVIHSRRCDLANVVVSISGSALDIKSSAPAGINQTCDWVADLTVPQDAEAAEGYLILQWPNQSSLLLSIAVGAKSVGPIPPGLKPSVDVAWKVVSRQISSDNFGSRVTKLYYPIEVAIGNNSGYDLQLAAIEFELPAGSVFPDVVPADSYYVVRSSLEREQAVGFRNATVNVIKAIGPILTGSSVFFNGTSLAARNHKNLFLGLTGVFSNPFEKGFELIAPDQTVRQLINLDNRTLRDGLIIANNTQIRSVVFVDRELVAKSIIAKAKGRQVSVTAGDSKGSQTAANGNGKKDTSNKTNVGNRDLTTPITPEQAKVDARELNSNGFFGAFSKHDYDPQEVMKYLGKLRLVGREVQYLNRVSVTANPPGPAPIITGKSGDSATEGGSAVTLGLAGDSLSGAKLLSPDPKLAISNSAVGENGRSFTALVDPKNAEPKTYQLILSTASGNQIVPFVVNPADIVLTSTDPASISFPAGTEKDVIIKGRYLKNVSKIGTGCTGVTATVGDASAAGDSLPAKLVATNASPVTVSCQITLTGKSGNFQTFSIAVTARTN